MREGVWALGLPVLILSPLAGIAADRFVRRRLLAVIQVGNAVPAFGVAILSALKHKTQDTWE